MEPLEDATLLLEPLLAAHDEDRLHHDDEEDVDDQASVRPSSPILSWANGTLFPDTDWKIGDRVVFEGGFSVKLIKFVVLTLVYIFYIHWMVSHRESHRDAHLRAWTIWEFDAGLIVRDSVVFFLVGRLWEKPGVDHLAWTMTVLGCNIFVELQHYVPWLRHSFTLYEMHCTWEWQTWAYLGLVGVISTTVAALHVWKAWQDKILLVKTSEVVLCTFFFLLPVLPSPYFHFHHWFAGWLVGMHLNFDVWWSSLAMAWCHGLYINGIAVYGRDPLLTCEYAYFLSWDQKCPYLECTQPAIGYDETSPTPWFNIVPLLSGWQNLPGPADWRNCSSGYHP